jgi:hypothetical protein
MDIVVSYTWLWLIGTSLFSASAIMTFFNQVHYGSAKTVRRSTILVASFGLCAVTSVILLGISVFSQLKVII